VSDRAREVQVVRAGLLTTVQDAGRPSLAHLGVPRSGALDVGAWRLANRLAGNAEDAAALETTVNGVTLRACSRCSAAVAGAQAAVTVNGKQAGWGIPVVLGPGDILNVGPATAGVRCYVACSGGVAVPPVFGSRATDLLSGLGPPPVRDGDILPLGPVQGMPPAVDFAPYPAPAADVVLTLHPGPRYDWLSEDGMACLAEGTWSPASASNRIALRLEGPRLDRAVQGELPSEGIVLGSVQVPPDGQPLIFLADHPTTGGYPVVGIVDPADIGTCAQAGVGATVSFHVTNRRGALPAGAAAESAVSPGGELK
jgi:biotin-dependent carboxylase-like uncharacterized protein